MWRSPVRIILIVVIVMVAGGIVLILSSYRYMVNTVNLVDTTIEQQIDIGLKTVHHVAVKNGKKLWDIHSETIQRVNGQSHFSPLTVTFFPHTGDAITLTGAHGIANDNKNIEIKGDIIITQGPWQLICDSLEYSYSQHDIIGKNHIAVTGSGMTLTANAMHYDLSNGQMTIMDDVTLTVNPGIGIKKNL